MLKQTSILKFLIIPIVFIFSFIIRVDALSISKFIGNEQEIEKMMTVEGIFPESDRKIQLETLINDSSENIRWNTAKMLAEIGDSQSLNLLLAQINQESDWLIKDQQIQAVYAIKFRQAVLTGQKPEYTLLEFFSSDYYPLKTGEPSGEPYDATIYILYQLGFLGSQDIRTQINKILEISESKDLGLLPKLCQDVLSLLNNSRIPQKYVVALKTGDLALRYWAAKELSKRPKTEILTNDGKTIVDLLKAQLFFAEINGYESYYNYINNILQNIYGETIDYIEPVDLYDINDFCGDGICAEYESETDCPADCISPKSIIKNTGTEPLVGYLLMKVQKYYSYYGWRDYQAVIKENTPRTIQPGQILNLRDIWNNQNYITKEVGQYRIYTAFLDEGLANGWQFGVISSGISPTGPTSPISPTAPAPTSPTQYRGLRGTFYSVSENVYRFFRSIQRIFWR